ncbi:MAG: mechanosensitive ion channel domain-containing protein [Planctomycetota bacterium]
MRWITPGMLLGGLLLLVGAVPSTELPPAAGNGDEPALEASEQTVKVEGETNDRKIAQRLREIYEASGRYEGLSVEVRDGIVFLEGETSSDAYKAWASELARKTEDVVAVVNDMSVTPPPVLETDTIAREVVELWRGFVRSLPLIGIGLVVLIACVLLAGLIGRLLTVPLKRLTDSTLLRSVVRKIVAVLVILGGLYLFLRITGLTAIALTVVSGTGIIGLVIGFAFRDIAENFLASILISVQTPFQIGDVVEVTGYTGVVQKVTMRGTVLVDFDGNHIQIANATIYKSTIKNFTANPKLRLTFVIGIGYDASVKLAQDAALKVLNHHSAVLDDPEPTVLADNLGSSTINMKIYFWIDGSKHNGLKVKSSMIRLVLRALENAGISMPDDAREIIFPDGVPVRQVEEPTKPAPASTPATVIDTAEEATAGEDGLTSDVDDIRKQAEESRDPEEGADILPSDPKPV